MTLLPNWHLFAFMVALADVVGIATMGPAATGGGIGAILSKGEPEIAIISDQSLRVRNLWRSSMFSY